MSLIHVNRWGALCALVQREIWRFTRQRSRLIGALATPLMFWLVMGGGFRGSFQDPSSTPGGGYFEFFFPGILLLSVLFTAIFSTISVIEDRNQGFMQGVLVSPLPRSTIVLSKVLAGGLLGLVQGWLLLCLAPLTGLQLDFVIFVEATLLLFSMALLLTALGFYFAWKIDSVQGYHSIMNMVLMPMWLLSGGVFPLSEKSPFFQIVGRFNPLNYGLASLRSALTGTSSLSQSIPVACGTIVLTFILVLLSVRMMRTQKNA